LLVTAGCSAESTNDTLLTPVPAAATPPPVAVSSPVDRQVFQMNDARRGAIRIAGTYTGDVVSVQARATVAPGGSGKSTKWVVVDPKPANGKYSGDLMVDAGGWYKVEVKTIDKAKAEHTATVERVGVGLVFITS